MYSSGFPTVYNCQNNLKDIFPLQLNLEQSRAHFVSNGSVGDGVGEAALDLQHPHSFVGHPESTGLGVWFLNVRLFRAEATYPVWVGRGVSAQHSYLGT